MLPVLWCVVIVWREQMHVEDVPSVKAMCQFGRAIWSPKGISIVLVATMNVFTSELVVVVPTLGSLHANHPRRYCLAAVCVTCITWCKHTHRDLFCRYQYHDNTDHHDSQHHYDYYDYKNV